MYLVGRDRERVERRTRELLDKWPMATCTCRTECTSHEFACAVSVQERDAWDLACDELSNRRADKAGYPEEYAEPDE